jgi:DNA-binding CsgD family transcriptional regulator
MTNTAVKRIERVPTSRPLSPTQFAVAVLVGMEWSYREIARELGLSERVTQAHVHRAAKKIPGDLPFKARVATWIRGASMSVLTGDALYTAVQYDARSMRREFPALAEEPQRMAVSQ